MNRRSFMVLLGGTAWPLAARAQQPAGPIVGFLGSGTPADWVHFVTAFRQGLGEAGYQDGRNAGIEFRSAEGQGSRLPALAADLAGRRVSVIVASVGIVAARAALAASADTPVVFVMGGDPVALGVVDSLNRPGGRVTGVSSLLNVLAAKRIGLLRDLVPTATVIGLLVNPDNPNAEADAAAARAAADAFGQETHVAHARSERDLDSAFASLRQQRVGALFVASDPLFLNARSRLTRVAASLGVPAIYDRRELTEAGGLLSYGTNFADAHRLAGVYVGRILRGEKPADLPVLQPTKFELVINVRTAKALGLDIPSTLLALADEVIE
jgi:putative ABC transport system substrate-binding protein